MKKLLLVVLLLTITSSLVGCNIFKPKNDFSDLKVNSYSKVDDLGEKFAVYYNIEVKNNGTKAYDLGAEIVPGDELKKLFGNQTQPTVSEGVVTANSKISGTNTTVYITETVTFEKGEHTLEEVEKMAKEYKFYLNNGNYKKLYE